MIDKHNTMNERELRRTFEEGARKRGWNTARSPNFGYYLEIHVEFAFIGFCMAHGVEDYAGVP